MSKEGRSTLRIDISDDEHDFYVCGNRGCTASINTLAYSAYHAGVLGWRRVDLSVAEAAARGCYELFLLICPACAGVKEGLNG